MKKADTVVEAMKAEIKALRAAQARTEALLRQRPAPAVTGTVIPLRKPKKYDAKWKATFKVCPHCGQTKVVDRAGNRSVEDFGVRNQRGVERPQPWCRKCRSGMNYHNLPRKNRSVNNPG